MSGSIKERNTFVNYNNEFRPQMFLHALDNTFNLISNDIFFISGY